MSPRAASLGITACRACGLVCSRGHEEQSPAACPRCRAPLHARKPNGVARAWALLVAALILYVPANTFPVMSTNLLGARTDSTILEGVAEFWAGGSYGIAVLILTASVLVPCAKFVALGVLLVSAQRKSDRARVRRARLYRMVELIGYWSMLDVIVVAIVAALVKFNALADIEPRIGILFFGLVVILTMTSAMNFDPRLTWDGDDE